MELARLLTSLLGRMHVLLTRAADKQLSNLLAGSPRLPRMVSQMKTCLRNYRSLGILSLLGVMTLSGCASFTEADPKKKKKDKSWYSFKKKEYQVPQAVNVTWAYDLLTVPGKPATRGFGGRFYFYNEKTQAIPVDGELMVYGFDDTRGSSDSTDLNQATKRFKFTAEQLTSHFSEGQLGASYSVWIPWDTAPGEQKKIMLIPTFIAKDGKLVRGAAATLNLPGKPRMSDSDSIAQAAATFTNGQRSEVSQAVQHAPRQQGVGITTINLPHRSAAARTPSGVLDLSAALEKLEAIKAEQLARDNANYFQPTITNSIIQPMPLAPSSLNAPDENLMGKSGPTMPSVANKTMFNSPGPIKEPAKIQFQQIESLNNNTGPTGFSGAQLAPQVSNGQQFHSSPNQPQAPASGPVPQSFYPIP